VENNRQVTANRRKKYGSREGTLECSANTGKETHRAEGTDISGGSTVSVTKVSLVTCVIITSCFVYAIQTRGRQGMDYIAVVGW
jgi:hypothetical protein